MQYPAPSDVNPRPPRSGPSCRFRRRSAPARTDRSHPLAGLRPAGLAPRGRNRTYVAGPDSKLAARSAACAPAAECHRHSDARMIPSLGLACASPIPKARGIACRGGTARRRASPGPCRTPQRSGLRRLCGQGEGALADSQPAGRLGRTPRVSQSSQRAHRTLGPAPVDHEIQEVVLEGSLVPAVLPSLVGESGFQVKHVYGRRSCHAGKVSRGCPVMRISVNSPWCRQCDRTHATDGGALARRRIRE